MPSRRCWPQPDADHLLVTGNQMAQLERELFASGLPVAALMEKAALALASRLRQRLRPSTGGLHGGGVPQTGLAWPASDGVLVLVGPGHNGGDGLVVARELHLAGVSIRIWSPFDRHKPLTAEHLRHALWLGIPRVEAPPDPADPALWLDALFGIGQHRPPGEMLETLLEERQRRRPGALVAVDGPTGLCADSGHLLGWGGATAALTWSIGLLKRGFVQDRALARVGKLERLDLGLPASLLGQLPASTPLGLRGGDEATAPWPSQDPSAAKYARGRALLVAGSVRYRGAAALALAGATASGCGSLKAALPEELASDLWLTHPHVVLEAAVSSGHDGALELASLAGVNLDRLDALLLGPGLGLPEHEAAAPCNGDAEAECWERLQAFTGLLVLDADGLNRLAHRRWGLAGGASAWLRGRRGVTWLTPHWGEFTRLFPERAGDEPLAAAAAAAAESGAAVLLKGARTVVAAADGRLWQVLQAAPQVARAGLGDTLAGFAVGRGAMAVAALAQSTTSAFPQRHAEQGSSGTWAPQESVQAGADPRPPRAKPDAALLAAVALEHAEAGRRCLLRRGPGGATPQAVALELGVEGWSDSSTAPEAVGAGSEMAGCPDIIGQDMCLNAVQQHSA